MISPDPLIVPVYRAMTIAGTALQRDEDGEVSHLCVVDTTLAYEVEVMYEMK